LNLLHATKNHRQKQFEDKDKVHAKVAGKWGQTKGKRKEISTVQCEEGEMESSKKKVSQAGKFSEEVETKDLI